MTTEELKKLSLKDLTARFKESGGDPTQSFKSKAAAIKAIEALADEKKVETYGPKLPRAGTKRAKILELASRKEGVTGKELMELWPGWTKRHVREAFRIMNRQYDLTLTEKEGVIKAS